MFLLYINDITTDINSPLRLFADDCLLYRVINSAEDANMLQEDLNRLSEWANTWQLRFNVSKCTVIRCTRSLTPFNHVYTLNNHILNLSDQHTYLGVGLGGIGVSLHDISCRNISRYYYLLLLLIIIDCCADLKRVWCTKRVQLLLSITKEKQTYIIIQYLLYTRPYIHIDKLLNSY